MKCFYRAISLVAASFFVGMSNVSNLNVGTHWTGYHVIKAARAFERFINEDSSDEQK